MFVHWTSIRSGQHRIQDPTKASWKYKTIVEDFCYNAQLWVILSHVMKNVHIYTFGHTLRDLELCTVELDVDLLIFFLNDKIFWVEVVTGLSPGIAWSDNY